MSSGSAIAQEHDEPKPSALEYPAKLLTGVKLPNGWEIIKRLGTNNPEDSHLSPGFFSVGYLAQKGKDQAFLKAFDIEAAIALRDGGDKNDPSFMMLALQDLTGAFNSENSLLAFCKDSNLDKIVKVLDRGFVAPPAEKVSASAFPVPYLLFELAEGGDIRRFIGQTDLAEDYLRLRHLHSVAVGLQQLHTNHICHQDLKPANVLIFENQGAKIGDLGRASRMHSPAPHDHAQIPGDTRYAPPELLYGEKLTSWIDRREASDLYHFGSLIAFVFTGVAVNTALYEALNPDLHFKNWHGKYEDLLPHLNAAFTRVLALVGPSFPEWAREDLTQMLSQMCIPDYRKRGAPEARMQANNPIGLDRFISKLDILANKAKLQVKTKS